MKQAKDEATDEIEKYRSEREKQFKDFEVKVYIEYYVKCELLIKFDDIFSMSVHARVLQKKLMMILV